LAEVKASLAAVGTLAGYPTVLLLCTSEYPTPPANVHLRKLTTLRAEFPNLPLGYSDHTQGPLAASVATAFGAAVFEKHFTLSHDLPGADHWFSEDPASLAEWVAAIRTAYAMLGSPTMQPTAAELDMRWIARRSITAIRDIARGQTFTPDNLALYRPGTGLPPEMFEHVLGRSATRDVRAGELLQAGDF
jgi:N,N'-diacetyllegionaminate synthase